MNENIEIYEMKKNINEIFLEFKKEICTSYNWSSKLLSLVTLSA